MSKRRPSDISDHVLHGMTRRQWKQHKRRQLDALIRAFGNYRVGAAYCPGSHRDRDAISAALDNMKRTHSQAEWGR